MPRRLLRRANGGCFIRSPLGNAQFVLNTDPLSPINLQHPDFYHMLHIIHEYTEYNVWFVCCSRTFRHLQPSNRDEAQKRLVQTACQLIQYTHATEKRVIKLKQLLDLGCNVNKLFVHLATMSHCPRNATFEPRKWAQMYLCHQERLSPTDEVVHTAFKTRNLICIYQLMTRKSYELQEQGKFSEMRSIIQQRYHTMGLWYAETKEWYDEFVRWFIEHDVPVSFPEYVFAIALWNKSFFLLRICEHFEFFHDYRCFFILVERGECAIVRNEVLTNYKIMLSTRTRDDIYSTDISTYAIYLAILHNHIDLLVILVAHFRSFHDVEPHFGKLGKLICEINDVESLDDCIHSPPILEMFKSYIQGQSVLEDVETRPIVTWKKKFNQLNSWKAEFPWCLGTLDTTPWM